MRYEINKAAQHIAELAHTELGIRRTYDVYRMKISWQLLKNDCVVGMLDLVCNDGFGQDGMDWEGWVEISIGEFHYKGLLLSRWWKYRNRKAKRLTRKAFVQKVQNFTPDLKKRLDKPTKSVKMYM